MIVEFYKSTFQKSKSINWKNCSKKVKMLAGAAALGDIRLPSAGTITKIVIK